MRGESEVPGGVALNLISTNYPDYGHHGRLPLSRKNANGRAGIFFFTWHLFIVTGTLVTIPHAHQTDTFRCWVYLTFPLVLWLRSGKRCPCSPPLSYRYSPGVFTPPCLSQWGSLPHTPYSCSSDTSSVWSASRSPLGRRSRDLPNSSAEP